MPFAPFHFGWEPESFYRQWASFELDADDLEELRGPALMRLAPQSRYAPALLDRIRSVLKDPAYVDRIVRHYQMFRDAIESGAGPKRKISMGWSDEKRKQRCRERKRAQRKRRSEPSARDDDNSSPERHTRQWHP